MRAKKTKGIQVSVEQSCAQRLAFVRKFKHRLPHLNDELESAILSVIEKNETKAGIEKTSWRDSKPCPECSCGVLFPKKPKGKPGPPTFLGCNRFPKCRHTENIKDKI